MDTIKEVSASGLAPVVGYDTKLFRNITPEDIDRMYTSIKYDFIGESLSLLDADIVKLKHEIRNLMGSENISYSEVIDLYNKIITFSVPSTDIYNLKLTADDLLCHIVFYKNKYLSEVNSLYGPNLTAVQSSNLLYDYGDIDMVAIHKLYSEWIPVGATAKLIDLVKIFKALSFNQFIGTDCAKITADWLDIVDVFTKLAPQFESTQDRRNMDCILIMIGYDVRLGYDMSIHNIRAYNQKLLNYGFTREMDLLKVNYCNKKMSNYDFDRIKSGECDVIHIIESNGEFVIKTPNSAFIKDEKSNRLLESNNALTIDGKFALNIVVMNNTFIKLIEDSLINGEVTLYNIVGIDSTHRTGKLIANLFEMSKINLTVHKNVLSDISIITISDQLTSHRSVNEITNKMFNVINISDACEVYGNIDREHPQSALSEAILLNKQNSDNVNMAEIDSEGSIIIKNKSKADFMSHYSQSHKLLLSYEQSENYNSIKYELAKLWFMNVIIEGKIMHNKSMLITSSRRENAIKARAFILNDFKKYLKLVLDNDKDFNFQEYYNNTLFAYEEIKINGKVIKATKMILKAIIL